MRTLSSGTRSYCFIIENKVSVVQGGFRRLKMIYKYWYDELLLFKYFCDFWNTKILLLNIYIYIYIYFKLDQYNQVSVQR